MKYDRLSHDEVRLVAFIADALQKHMRRDGGILAACAALRGSGTTVVVEVTLAAGDAPARVTAPGTLGDVPQWNQEDEEILRSLGIASDDSSNVGDPSHEPGRRQPR